MLDKLDRFTSVLLPTIVLTALVHGAYILFFIFCLYILFTRKVSGFYWHLSTTVLLFSLVTASVILQIFHQYQFFLSAPNSNPPRMLTHLATENFLLPGLTYLTADIVLIRRCYAVWEHDVKVIILPSLLLLGATVIGIFESIKLFGGSEIPLYVFYGIMIAINLLVTGLTSARILWLTSEASQVFGYPIRRSVTTVVTVILESGFVYSVVLILTMVAFVQSRTYTESVTAFAFYMIALSVQFSGIMPTLLVVRVGLGINSIDIDNSMGLGDITADMSRSFTVQFHNESGESMARRGDKMSVFGLV